MRPAFERVVVLAPASAREHRSRLRSELDEASKNLEFELVFGDAAGESGFELAAAERASAILLMPISSGPVAAEMADVETIQTGLALRNYLNERGSAALVCLLFRRERNVDAAWELFPEDWDGVGSERFDVTVLSRRGVFNAYLGAPATGTCAAPAPRRSWCCCTSAISSTHGRRCSPSCFCPDHAGRLPADPNLFAIASLNAIAAATALGLVDPEAAAELERRFSSSPGG
jgi:hypothetical protein